MNKEALTLAPDAYNKVNRSIIVSGSARSGTTLLGKLIHSLIEVEYQFEPSQLFALIPLIHQLPENQWRLLYETYLYEEFFINALAGRSLNCNQADDSSIYNVKSHQEINARLNATLGKAAVMERQEKHRIAFKMPDILPYLNRIRQYYPGTQFVIIEREPSAVIKSVIAKGWFTDKSLKQGQLLWPNYRWTTRSGETYFLPFWLNTDDAQQWLDYAEHDRAAFYCLHMTVLGRSVDKATLINYQDLVSKPSTVLNTLLTALQLTEGPKTQTIMGEIFADKPVDKTLLSSITEDIRTQLQSCFPLSN